MVTGYNQPHMRRVTLLIVLIALLAGCGEQPILEPASSPSPSPTVIPATLTPTPPPSPEAAAANFLNAWEEGDYGAMYNLLSPGSQAVTDAGSFVGFYQDTLDAATALTVTTELRAVLQQEDQAQASFDLTLDTALVGQLVTDTVLSLTLSDGQWGVNWNAGLVWPQLIGGHQFRMDYTIPTRANIYDRNGLGLATEGTLVTISIIPEQVENEDALLEVLEQITGLSPNEIKGRYVAAPADQRVPIADIPAEKNAEYDSLLSYFSGIYREEREGRTYPHGDAAPHLIGWVAPVPAEELAAYRARGYRGEERVGIFGLEAWGEEALAGQHGGTLTIVTPAGEKVADVASSPAEPGRAIYTTIDRGFQEQVQHILGDRKGAIVVLDVRTGAVRALASGPAFNLNIFAGPAGAVGRSQVLADTRNPFFNRATLGAYPCGSVFKIITMAAGMEAAGMDPATTSFYCPGYWEGLGPGARRLCWNETGHGDIVLQDGLTASCNVVFYTVGKTLDDMGSGILPQFARDFGFGVPTGLKGLAEESGLVPDPAWKESERGENWGAGDTVNLAIGQGNLKVTPLQVARMMAAVANGGTLYRPYVVERIEGIASQPEKVTQPQVVGNLPISSEHLVAMQKALLGVTTRALGTAEHRFIGLGIPVAGKTGTAEVGTGAQPHSWFAAYAPAYSTEIAIAVMVENAGEGSTVAAPLARQVIEAYYGLALSPLPPQAEEDYVPPTPTPETTE